MRLYVVQSRTSSEKYLLQFTKFLGVIHVRGSSFLMGGSDYINYALKQESCHYLNLPKFWVVLTKDNSFVIPYPVYCLAGTRILEVLGLFLLYPWTPDSRLSSHLRSSIWGDFPSTFLLGRFPTCMYVPGTPFLHTGSLRQQRTYFSLSLGSLSSAFWQPLSISLYVTEDVKHWDLGRSRIGMIISHSTHKIQRLWPQNWPLK